VARVAWRYLAAELLFADEARQGCAMDSERFRLQTADFESAAMQVAMPVVSDHDGDLRCIGTAFAVAPGLAITAAHVVQDWEDYYARVHGFNDGSKTYGVVALQLCAGRLCEWRVDGISTSWTADVAFLRFAKPAWYGDGPGQVKPPCGRLSVNPPRLGDDIRVFGFPNSVVDENRVLTISPAVCVARVREIALKSDLRTRPTSYVELDGEIAGGMSGGPCFDKDGNIVGMASKGCEFLDGPPVWYMALLWPAMGVQIDLFKTGAVPAWNIFKAGKAQAIGHRRLHVTADGGVRLAKTDPDSLATLPASASKEHLQGAINFCAENALRILNGLRKDMDAARANGEGRWDANSVHSSLRHFFWELDSALCLAIRLAAVNAKVASEGRTGWDQLVKALERSNPDAAIKDALATLSFSWNGVDLFELRTYAERARVDILVLQAVSRPEGEVIACMLSPCRHDGQQVNLPEGLERFYEAAKSFVQRLLRLSLRIGADNVCGTAGAGRETHPQL
jgi:hypothetical protein